MSDMLLFCESCNYRIAEETEYCPSCGAYITQEVLDNQHMELRKQQITQYNELKLEIANNTEIEHELQSLSIIKDKTLSQMSNCDVTLVSLNNEQRSMKTLLDKFHKSNIVKRFYLKLVKGQSPTSIQNELDSISSTIKLQDQTKKQLQKKFNETLSDIEEYQELIMVNKNKQRLITDIKYKLLQDIHDERRIIMESELRKLNQQLTHVNFILQSLEGSKTAIDDGITIYHTLSDELDKEDTNFKEVKDKNALLADARKTSKTSKIKLMAQEIDDKLTEALNILVAIENYIEQDNMDDFEILVKYLRSYLKDRSGKFKQSDRIRSDLDLCYAQSQKIKSWVNKYSNHYSDTYTTLQTASKMIQHNLDQLITELVDDYVNQFVSVS